jgi:hypothetical protein
MKQHAMKKHASRKTWICAATLVLACGVAATQGRTQSQKPAKIDDGAPRNKGTDSATTTSPEKTAAAKPIEALSWVIGGVWTADATKLGPGMQRIETRYQWSDNNAYIRFTTHFVFDKGTAKTHDGNFFWNPAQKNLAMWYMDARNGITEGPVQVDGNQWTIQIHGPDFEGKMADLRVLVMRKTNDQYHWSVEEKQGDIWKELAALEYLRLPGQ